MQFHPEKCRIPDEPNKPFISSEEIWDYINNTKSTPERVHEIIQKSLDKNRLTMEETAVLAQKRAPFTALVFVYRFMKSQFIRSLTDANLLSVCSSAAYAQGSCAAGVRMSARRP